MGTSSVACGATFPSGEGFLLVAAGIGNVTRTRPRLHLRVRIRGREIPPRVILSEKTTRVVVFESNFQKSATNCGFLKGKTLAAF